MSNGGTKGLFTDDIESRVIVIPPSDVNNNVSDDTSVDQLMSSTSSQIPTPVRSEIELAKAKIVGETKRSVVGGGLFAVTGVVALYFSLFFSFFLGWLLDI